MYTITSSHADRLTIHRVFPQALAPTADGQRLIRNAERDGYQLRCLCSGRLSSPLHSRAGDYGALHLCRVKETEYEHVPGCKHGDPSDNERASNALRPLAQRLLRCRIREDRLDGKIHFGARWLARSLGIRSCQQCAIK